MEPECPAADALRRYAKSFLDASPAYLDAIDRLANGWRMLDELLPLPSEAQRDAALLVTARLMRRARVGDHDSCA